jgi:hypothetical protein
MHTRLATLFGIAAIAAALTLAGCRSTGIAYNPPTGGNIVTLVISGSPTIAYQDTLHGAWKALPAGQTQFTVTNGTAYGVAYACGVIEAGSVHTSGSVHPETPEEEVVGVFQATTTEINVVPVVCGTETATLAGTYDATAVEGAADVDVNGDEVGDESTSGSYSINAVPGTQDVFGTAWNDEDELLALKTYPGVNVAATGTTTQNVTISSSDDVGGPDTLSITNEPGTEDEEYAYVFFGNFEYTAMQLAYSGSSSVSYPTVAAADIASDDAYIGEGFAYVDGPGTAIWLEHDYFASSLPSSIALTAPYDQSEPTFTGNPKFALNYTGYAGLTGGISGYEIGETWDGEGDGGLVGAVVTSGFLKAAGTTSYAVPAITVAGFPSMTAESGDSYVWTVRAVYGTPEYLAYYAYYTAYDLLTSTGQNRNPQSIGAHPMMLGGGPRGLAAAVRIQDNATPASGDGYWAAADDCYTVGASEGC